MNQEIEPQKKGAAVPPKKEEPGLLDSVGSFPLWLLKIIDFFTPDFLISKSPPKKKNYRI